MRHFVSLFLLFGFLADVRAQFIWVNLSFKAVLNPADGSRYYNFTEANLDLSIARMNVWLGTYERGYRVRRVGPIQNVGGSNDFTGPSKWYSVNPRGTNLAAGASDNRKRMEIEALNDPVRYAWDYNAVNYYVTAGFGPPIQDAGECAFPSGNNHLIVLGTVDHPQTILHETGHYFELYHTQGPCGCPRDCGCPDSNCTIFLNGYWVGDDGIADTLPVQPGDYCFTNQNLVALANFNLLYASCDDVQRNLVDDTFFNLMAYGFDRELSRLTPVQLDKWTFYANSSRLNVVSGRTRYVSLMGSDSNSGLTATTPKRHVLAAANSAALAGSDIVLLRPGSYDEQITITNRVTLRAARTNSFIATAKWATIGR